jgi:enoyl-CoA hydratase/carnithine racemase
MPSEDNTSNSEKGAVLLERTGSVAILTLSRPAALNALTWSMYEQLDAHLNQLAVDDTIRAIIMRGDGPRAFAAGTDIAQFQGFSGADGVAYEQRMDTITDRLYSIPKPLIAAVHGVAVGAGLMITTACDLRYATPEARFGAPMARTLGNCLSLKNYRRLVQAFGSMRTKELLFTARLLSAVEALQSGFLTAIVDEAQIFTRVLEVAQQISDLAPLTIWATKEALRRMNTLEEAKLANIPFDDVLARVYGSLDFAEGVQAHVEKRRPVWRGE